MSIATTLLKANHVGVRNLKEHLSAKILKEILVVTDRGIPVSVNIPYSDILELTDILDELSDPETLASIEEGRRAIGAGMKGRSVYSLFKRIRAKRK